MNKKRYLIIAVVVLLIIGFLSVTQCQEKTGDDKGDAASDLQQDAVDDEEFSGNATDDDYYNGTSDSAGDGEGYEPGAQTGGCDETNCAAPGTCYQGRCKVPECMTDADCVNDDPCLPDVCEFAGHPNAFCSTTAITEWKNNDGCCPVGANVDKDVDCAPVCGNHRCEYGERTVDCPEDCRNAGPGAAPQAPSGNG
jgi:hypothetical protein